MSFTDGYLDSTKRVYSPNFGGEITPRFIVMHYTAGWNAESAIDILTRSGSRVSAHFVIERDGTLTQLVSCNVSAWHAGPSRFEGYSGLNSHSIGIEFVNIGYLKPTEKHYALDPYGHERMINALPMKGGTTRFISAPHPRIGGGVYLWPTYTPEQLECADELVTAIMDQYQIQDVLSHEQIDTRGWKTDPGPAFPMDRYRALVDAGTSEDSGYVVTAQPFLNVRGGPGTGFERIGRLSTGARCQVVSRKGAWYEIGDGRTGWVHSAYLVRA